MLNTSFFVFVNGPDTDRQAQIISTLKLYGFHPLVDSVNGSSKAWFRRNMACPHKLFSESGESYEFDENAEQPAPIMAVCFNMDDTVEPCDWSAIDEWILDKCFSKYGLDQWLVDKGDSILTRPIEAVAVETTNNDEPEKPESNFYDISIQSVDHKDTTIYEVKKPHTDRPYTVVVKNFSRRGHTPFFSSLFICSSWGVCSEDITFLQQVWDKLDMDGVFDINALVKTHVEKCTPGSGEVEQEPVVYRKSTAEVLKTLENNNKGFIIR